MKNILSYDEFVALLQSDEPGPERKTIEDYFSNERINKRILSFDEWSQSGIDKFIFLTYDLVDVEIYRNRYAPINRFLERNLGFIRQINQKNLPANSFVTFLNPINERALQNMGNQLVQEFFIHLPNFRIYMNITDSNKYFLHP